MHDRNLISEEPTVYGEHTYTARRNAYREPDGSQRWQVFRSGDQMPALVGYLQSHACEDDHGAVCILAFDSANRPVGVAGKRATHACVTHYSNALAWLREREAGRA